MATHIHVREVNKSVAALPGKVVGRISREVAPSGITDLHGQRFQQRKGLFHAVFTDDKRTQLAFVVHPSCDHPLCFGGDVPVQIAALGFPAKCKGSSGVLTFTSMAGSFNGALPPSRFFARYMALS